MSENLKSVISLTLICLVVSSAVVFSHRITKPHIDRASNEAAFDAIKVVLPDAKNFNEIDVSKEILTEYGCTFLRKSEDSSAVAIQIEARGYQQGLVVMVGIGADKKISGVHVVQHAETEGIGTRAMTKDYLSAYKGKENTENIDLLSGATYTSEGIKNAVENALGLFDRIKGELNR